MKRLFVCRWDAQVVLLCWEILRLGTRGRTGLLAPDLLIPLQLHPPVACVVQRLVPTLPAAHRRRHTGDPRERRSPSGAPHQRGPGPPPHETRLISSVTPPPTSTTSALFLAPSPPPSLSLLVTPLPMTLSLRPSPISRELHALVLPYSCGSFPGRPSPALVRIGCLLGRSTVRSRKSDIPVPAPSAQGDEALPLHLGPLKNCGPAGGGKPPAGPVKPGPRQKALHPLGASWEGPSRPQTSCGNTRSLDAEQLT